MEKSSEQTQRECVHVSVQMHGRLARDLLQMCKTWFSFLVCMVQSNAGWKTTLWPLNWVEWKFNLCFLTARRLLWLMVCFPELESRDFWFSGWSCHSGISWKYWAEILVFQQKGWVVWINLRELTLEKGSCLWDLLSARECLYALRCGYTELASFLEAVRLLSRAEQTLADSLAVLFWLFALALCCSAASLSLTLVGLCI